MLNWGACLVAMATHMCSPINWRVKFGETCLVAMATHMPRPPQSGSEVGETCLVAMAIHTFVALSTWE